MGKINQYKIDQIFFKMKKSGNAGLFLVSSSALIYIVSDIFTDI